MGLFWSLVHVGMLVAAGLLLADFKSQMDKEGGVSKDAALKVASQPGGIVRFIVGPLLLILFGWGGFYWSRPLLIFYLFLAGIGFAIVLAIIEKVQRVQESGRRHKTRINEMEDRLHEIDSLLGRLNVEERSTEIDGLVTELRSRRSDLEAAGVLKAGEEPSRASFDTSGLEIALRELKYSLQENGRDQRDALRSIKGSNRSRNGFALFLWVFVPMIFCSFLLVYGLTDFRTKATYRSTVKECAAVHYPDDSDKRDESIRLALNHKSAESGIVRFYVNFLVDAFGCSIFK